MNDVLNRWLSNYQCQSTADYQNALKEIIQQIALLALWRSNFFNIGAFYGGTALRILYGLERYSEDLDFSLLKTDNNFSLEPYNKAIQKELHAYGLEAEVLQKDKKKSQIESAFIKAGTLIQLIQFEAPEPLYRHITPGEVLKIKWEVDTNPPQDFSTEQKFLLQPTPFSINSYTLPSCFSGKMHALLCRQWKTRVKGRDWFDLIWFIQNNIPLDLRHFTERMRQTHHWENTDDITSKQLLNMMKEKISTTDFTLATNDVARFIKNQDSLQVWSASFFTQIIERIYFT